MTKTDSTGAHAEPGRVRQHLAHVAANLCGLEKEQAAANFKGGFGFHPLGVWCDNTGELLAIRLRPGNANANHAQDHIDLLGDAISQIPAAHRRSMLVRADSAGASHQVLDWLTEQGQVRGRSVEYSIGFPIHKGIAGPRRDPHAARTGLDRGYGCRR